MFAYIVIDLCQRLQIVVGVIDSKSELNGFTLNCLHNFLDIHHHSVLGVELRRYSKQLVVINPKSEFLPVDNRRIVIKLLQDAQKALKVNQRSLIIPFKRVLDKDLK